MSSSDPSRPPKHPSARVDAMRNVEARPPGGFRLSQNSLLGIIQWLYTFSLHRFRSQVAVASHLRAISDDSDNPSSDIPIHPPSSKVINAALDFLLTGIGVENAVSLPINKDVSMMSVREVRLQAAALVTLADNTIRREAEGRIAALHRHLNKFASISALPEELLVQVLRLAVVGHRRPLLERQVDVHRVVELARVCSRWCHIIRDNAILWTCISNRHPSQMITLQRSQQALLDLHFVGHAGSENFFEWLDPHRHRWRSIVLDYPRYVDTDGDSDSDGDANVFDHLWGPKLLTLHVTYSSRLSTPVTVPLPLTSSPHLTELVMQHITISNRNRLRGPLPELTILYATGFDETPHQWCLILELIAASSQRLQELVVAPRAGDSAFSRLHLAEVDNQDTAPLELLELRKLDVAQMPPNTFAVFFSRLLLDPATLTTVVLLVVDPLDQTLDEISNPASCSASRIIHSISTSQLEAALTITVGEERNRFHYDAYTDSPNDRGFQITLDAREVVPSVMIHMSPLFNHDQSPSLHVQLFGDDLGILDQETMASFVEATRSTVTFQASYGPPSTHVFALLKELADAPWTDSVWWWPKLSSIIVDDLEDVHLVEEFRENLMAIMANRSLGFDAGLCQKKVTVQDRFHRIIHMDGKISSRSRFRIV